MEFNQNEITYIWRHQYDNSDIKMYATKLNDYEEVDYIAILDFYDHSILTDSQKKAFPGCFFFKGSEQGATPHHPKEATYLKDLVDIIKRTPNDPLYIENFKLSELEMSPEIVKVMDDRLAGILKGFLDEHLDADTTDIEPYLTHRAKHKKALDTMLNIATSGEYTEIR